METVQTLRDPPFHSGEAENGTWYWMAARCFGSSGSGLGSGARASENDPSDPFSVFEAMTLDLLAWHGQRLRLLGLLRALKRAKDFKGPQGTATDSVRALQNQTLSEASLLPSSMTSLPTVCLILLSRPT